jgi:hypothetical protein
VGVPCCSNHQEQELRDKTKVMHTLDAKKINIRCFHSETKEIVLPCCMHTLNCHRESEQKVSLVCTYLCVGKLLTEVPLTYAIVGRYIIKCIVTTFK